MLMHNLSQIWKLALPTIISVMAVVVLIGIYCRNKTIISDPIRFALEMPSDIIYIIVKITTKILLLLNNIFNFATNINIIKWSKFLSFMFVSSKCINKTLRK